LYRRRRSAPTAEVGSRDAAYDVDRADSSWSRALPDLLRALGLDPDLVDADERGVRVRVELLEREAPRPHARYVVVTGTARAGGTGAAATALAAALRAGGARALVTRRGGAGRRLPGGDDARALRIVRALLCRAAAGRAV